MNGLMTNYKNYAESLENTPEPVPVKDMPVIDYKSLIAYARSKGVKVYELSSDEQKQFISFNKSVAIG